MRNYIILNGKNSNEINGLLIQELPPISKPLIRTEVEEIDGRDGDIVTPLGYSAYDKELTIGLYKDFDVNEVAAYFNSEGTVIFSNEPDKYYYYQITAQIDFERLVRYRTATVTMHCQPFKYSATEQPITEDVSGTVSDEGTNLALENTAEAPFNTLDLKGNTEQDGTPTPDAPIPVQTVTGENVVKICGKNLLEMPIVSGSSNGITWTVQDDGSIILNGTSTAGVSIRANNVTIPAVEGETYTLSATGMGEAYNFGYKNSGSGENIFVVTSASPTTTAVVTSTMLSQANRLDMYIQPGKTFNNQRVTLQLEKGSTATTFEPYQDQSYEINLGKNLFDAANADVKTGYILNNSGVEVSDNTGGYTRNYSVVKPNTTYTISGLVNAGTRRIYYYDGAKNFISRSDGSGASSWQFTTPANCHYVNVQIHTNTDNSTSMASWQIEIGSQATSYAAYFEPIELCKIEGQGQPLVFDYIYRDGENWKLHKAITKQTIAGSEVGLQSNYTNVQFATVSKPENSRMYRNYIAIFIYNDHAKYRYNSSGWNNSDLDHGVFTTPNQDRYWFGYPKGTSLETMQQELDGAVTYYALATPTDTEITNEALIEQLDNIYYHAHAYKGRTHITSSAATGNVPHIIAAEVGEDNESTITNAGNYLSKPKITVYGSGDISLYINDMHVLQITLGDEGYITIDTAQMEAYKDTLDNLKNRLVIGDYSNAHLKPGANKIHFTGTVTKYVVENYSRWL